MIKPHDIKHRSLAFGRLEETMNLRAFLGFIETNCEEVCTPIELKGKVYSHRRDRPLRLVLDVEQCKVFLYGGYSNDWASGGEWSNMVRFLHHFIQFCNSCNIEISVFFNGTSVRERYMEWVYEQSSNIRRIQDIIRLIKTKGFHPPKVMWVEPVGLTSVLRLALNRFGVPTAASYSDHQQEIISYVRENNCDGFISWDADLMMFIPQQRYFSARKLFLSYSGTLSTCEISMADFAKTFNLDPSRFCILATLLGTHLMPIDELQEFYGRICRLSSAVHVAQYPIAEKIRAVISFVQQLPSIDDLDEIVKVVFGQRPRIAQLAEQFKSSVAYYQNGRMAALPKEISHQYSDGPDSFIFSQAFSSSLSFTYPDFGDGVKKEMKPSVRLPKGKDQEDSESCGGWDDGTSAVPDNAAPVSQAEDCTTSMTFGSSGYSNSAVHCRGFGFKSRSTELHPLLMPVTKWWHVAPEVLRIAQTRLQQGLMTPWIFQILVHGEIFISPLLEDEKEPHLIKAIELFRPFRQRIYSILVERASNKISDSDAVVKEWFLQSQPMPHPTYVEVSVPQPAQPQMLSQLWLGTSRNDDMLRVRVFLECLGCKPIESQLMDWAIIKPQFLVLCCVLRYMVIQKSALVVDEDAVRGFLATAVSSRLQNPKDIKQLNIPVMSVHCIHLAVLFMHGFENALFANEAFGLPFPVENFCPSQFFDGKLFQYKMAKISQKSSISDICENSLEQQMYLEKMLHTIVSCLPSDCAYSLPLLWNSSLSRSSRGPYNRNSGAPPGEPGPHETRGAKQNVHFVNENLVFRPAGASELPNLERRHHLTMLNAPLRRSLRPDVRIRHMGGRAKQSNRHSKPKIISDEKTFQQQNRPGRGQLVNSVRLAGPKCGMGRSLHHQTLPLATGPGFYGRGRGCTVESDLTYTQQTFEESLTASTFDGNLASELGQSTSSYLLSEVMVGKQQHPQQKTMPQSPSMQLRYSTQLESQCNLEKADDQFYDANINSHCQNADKMLKDDRFKAPADPTETDFADMPALIENCDVPDKSAQWADLIEAEEEILAADLSLESSGHQEFEFDSPETFQGTV